MPAREATSWPLSADQILDRLSANRWVAPAVNLAALVLLVYGLAQWTWQLLQPATLPAASTSQAPGVNQTAFDLQPLLAANLFGRVADTAARDVNPNQLPLSSLNLVLTGVMAQGKSSFAFLSINGGPETPFAIGQEITAGATLEAVYTDRIVLRRGAALESVLLKDSEATLPTGSIVTARPGGTNNAVRLLGGGVYGVDRQALTQNLTAQTLSQASVTSSASGLVVRDVQSGSMFEELGLRTGDVVRTINGQPVRSLDDLARIYGQLTGASQTAPIAVEVIRSGKTEVLQYQMQ